MNAVRYWITPYASRSLATIVCTLTCLSLLVVAHRASCQSPDNPTPFRAAEDYALKYREVQRAILVFKQGKHDVAKELLLDAKSKHAELPPVDVMMARLYLSANAISKAESALERVIVEAPDDPEAFVLLGDLALRAKRFAYAELAYNRARAILKDYEAIQDRRRNLEIRILAGLASLSESRGQYEKAVAYLQAWLQLDRKQPLALGSLGRVNFRSKKYEAARTAFTELSKRAPTAPPPEIAMARLFSDAGMHDKALREMKAALNKHAKDARVLLTVAEWALNNGLTDLAEANVAAALKLDQQSMPARVLEARLTRYAGNLEKAETILRELVPLSPNSFVLTDEFARTLAASDDERKREAALQHAERNYRALREDNSSMTLQAIITYAWTLFKNDQTAKAEVVAQSLPDGSAISNENGYYVASIFAGRGKKDVAVAMLKALLAEDRPFPLRDEAEVLLSTLANG